MTNVLAILALLALALVFVAIIGGWWATRWIDRNKEDDQ